MRQPFSRRQSVAVVGAGAVGLVTALALARHGFEVTVFEAEPRLRPTPRVNTLHAATLMMFERLGLVDDVLAIGQRSQHVQFRELADGVIAELDLSVLADVTRFPFRLHCLQDQLTRVIFEFVLNAKIPIHFDTRVVKVAQDDDRVQVEIECANHGEEIEFDYVVGADGSGSIVRDAIGIPFEEQSKPTRMVQIMTTYDLRKAWSDLAGEAYFMDAVSPCTIVQIPGSWRILLALPNAVTDRDLERNGWHRETLARIFALDRPISIFHETTYAVRTGVARTFRSNRFFIVGDAAHVSLPFGAMGVNCGIHDGYFLAKALYESIYLFHPSLDDWASTRKAAALKRAIAEGWTLFSTLGADESERTARNARLREIAGDPGLMRAYLLRTSMLDGAPILATL